MKPTEPRTDLVEKAREWLTTALMERAAKLISDGKKVNELRAIDVPELLAAFAHSLATSEAPGVAAEPHLIHHDLCRCVPYQGKKIAPCNCGVDTAEKLIADLRRQLEQAQRELSDYEEREAACCPEDVGFDEYIAVLEKKLAAALPSEEAIARVIRDCYTDVPGTPLWRNDIKAARAVLAMLKGEKP